VVKSEGRRPLGRPRWLANIRIDLVEVEWGDVDWIGLAESSCEFGIELSGSIKCSETVEFPNN
jgi:hypothetical protein